MIPKIKPWPVTESSPASSTSGEDGNQMHTTSPCMDLDDISSDSSIGDVSPPDFKVKLLYDSEDLNTPVGSIVDYSDDDVPLSSGQEDRHKVRKRDPRPMRQLRPTDGLAQEQTPKRRLVDGTKSEPKLKERPVDGPKFEPTTREWPVDGRKFSTNVLGKAG